MERKFSTLPAGERPSYTEAVCNAFLSVPGAQGVAVRPETHTALLMVSPFHSFLGNTNNVLALPAPAPEAEKKKKKKQTPRKRKAAEMSANDQENKPILLPAAAAAGHGASTSTSAPQPAPAPESSLQSAAEMTDTTKEDVTHSTGV